MATVPVSTSEIKILSGVPFQSDYKHTRWFDTQTQQSSYFNGRSILHQRQEFNFVRMTGSYQVRIGVNIDSIRNANYMMFANSGKWYYAFIESLEFVQRNTTLVHFNLDVVQTYMFDFSFNPSFIVREHQEPDIMNTVKEGLDFGEEYDTVDMVKYVPNDGLKFLVVVSKSPLHEGLEAKTIQPTTMGVPQPLSFYLLPFWDVSVGSDDFNDKLTPNVKVGSTGSAQPLTGPLQTLHNFYKSEDATNNIVSMYITEYPGISFTYSLYERQGDGTYTPGVLQLDASRPGQKLTPVGTADGQAMIYVDKVDSFIYHSEQVVSDYMDRYFSTQDNKLLQSPYIKLIMDDMKGNRVEYLPENINSKHLTVNIKGGLGHNNHVVYALENYNYLAGGSMSHKNELMNETALINDNPQDVAILNDNLAAFMQGNRNSMINQKNSIGFNSLFAAGSTGQAFAGNAGSGNAMGAIGSVAGAAQGLGNTVLQLQGIEAQINDIKTTPPQVTSMGSDTHFDYGNNYHGVYFIFKQIKSEYRKKLDDFFHMFGYKKNEVKQPNLHTHTHFNYIQTSSCHIKGSFNHEDMNELKGVFDNGITLWHTNDVGNYGLQNGVR